MTEKCLTKKNSWDTLPSGGSRAPKPRAGKSLSLEETIKRMYNRNTPRRSMKATQSWLTSHNPEWFQWRLSMPWHRDWAGKGPCNAESSAGEGLRWKLWNPLQLYSAPQSYKVMGDSARTTRHLGFIGRAISEIALTLLWCSPGMNRPDWCDRITIQSEEQEKLNGHQA